MESNFFWLLLMFFLRFVKAQTMETKQPKDSLQAFEKMISQKNTPEKLLVVKGSEYGGTFEKTLQGKRH